MGDFDDDGFDDLAIGVIGDRVGPVNNAGTVNALYGSSAGLTTAGSQLWHQNIAGVRGEATSGDLFGNALAVGDFDGDGFDDLAIGAARRGPDAEPARRRFSQRALRLGGRPQRRRQSLWHQNIAGVLGTAASGDGFGTRLPSATSTTTASTIWRSGSPARTSERRRTPVR